VKVLVIGCGRTGAAVAKGLEADGWDVTAVDESEDALLRLGAGWRGGFVLGHGLDRVVVRVLDPARARFYAERGLQTVCPTQTAISEMLEAVRTGQLEPAGPS